MKLYIRYMLIHFQSQMQYRLSFWLLLVGQFLGTFSGFIGLSMLFDRFGQLQGWSFYEVALCFGVIHLAFSLAECFGRGFDMFSSLVGSGDFDRLLVRPRHTLLQVSGSKVEFTKFGRVLQGLVVLTLAVLGLDVTWTWIKALVLLLMVLSGVIIFLGIFILAATFCFWTIQGLEVANIFTDGGREIAQYPLNIYERWVTRFFTFLIPFAGANYLPLLFLLDRTEDSSWWYALLPLSGFVFLLPCLLVWHIGVRHYRSTGS